MCEDHRKQPPLHSIMVIRLTMRIVIMMGETIMILKVTMAAMVMMAMKSVVI